ncbi:NAD(P)/FAD-dependent oxidoreductase [Nocardia fluminea]|uniref:Glycine/D-amino acid oxidase-like deaminating enzyme n=1 Tax=Nocardia fluminea TaxID=134984 RepID=A0A2N3VK35_9NOCA|nr:FAD-binding oxidoreductase [Nocardia fluminea]PKV81975.1 glycine/D-amino acid oxidase-like deaminating enzyme [Nocardia fluminea]
MNGNPLPDRGPRYTTFTGWVDRPTDLTPPLDSTLSCDVAVVGGGLGGMATALRLTERGADVVLLESEFCGYGASSRNAGQISAKPTGEPQILARVNPQLLRDLVRFAASSVRFSEDLLEQLGIECEYEAVGNVGAAVTKGQMRKAQRDARALLAAGADLKFGDQRELGLPDTFLGGMLTPAGGTMNPGLFTLGLRAALLGSGVRVFEESPVQSVQDVGSGAMVITPLGRIRAKKVVLANNAWAPELAITPQRLSRPVWVNMIETAPVERDRIVATGWTSRAGLATKHNVMESYHLTPADTIAVGVRQLKIGKNPVVERISNPGVVADLTDAFRARFPSLRDVAVTKTWGGWIAMTSSRAPVVGKASKNVYYAIGCNGHGLGQAPYLGSLLADHLTSDEIHEDMMPWWQSENRFPRSLYLHNPVLRAAWLADRIGDRRVGR